MKDCSTELEIVDPREYAGWDRLVAGLEGCTPFHTAAWSRVLVDSYGCKPMYFLNDNAEDRAALPLMEVRSVLTGRRGVSLPFTDAVPAIGQSPAAIRRFGNAVLEQGRQRRWKRVQLRGSAPFRSDAQPSATYLTHTLDLSQDEDQLFSNLSSSTRRAIRKAEKSNVQITIQHDAAAMREFCRLNALTRRDHGLPPQPTSFFNNIQRHMLDNNMGFIVLASLESHPIAAAMFFLTTESTEATEREHSSSGPCLPCLPWFNSSGQAIFKYAASDKRHQSTRANDLVMWHGILACKRAGSQKLNLGRTRKQNEGLLRFKRGWGGIESELDYCTYDFTQNTFTTDPEHVTGAHNTLFRRLPLPLSRLAGHLLYKHMA